MSGSQPMALDDAENIKRFVNMIPQLGVSSSATQQESLNSKVDGLNINNTKADNKTSPHQTSNKTSNDLSERALESTPLPPLRNRIPSIGAISAPSSPQVSGVVPPPSTPESVSNRTIGKVMFDELSKIPEDRTISLGDSKFAPKNPSRLTSNGAESNADIYTPLPRSSRPRDDEGFTRMSFRAAESALAPAVNFSEPVKANPKEPPMIGNPSRGTVAKENINPNALPDPVPPHLRPKQVQTGERAIGAAEVPDNEIDDISLPPQEVHTSELSTALPNEKAEKSLNEENNVLRSDPLMASALKKATNLQPNAVEPLKNVKVSIKPASDLALEQTLNLAKVNIENANGGPLTPSSMTFGVVSPVKLKATGIEAENLEDAIYFKAWPKAEDRGRPAAKVRKVTLLNIPPNSSPSLVASLVYGGPLERIAVKPSSADVTFLNADHCMNYYESTANGLLYESSGDNAIQRRYVITAELGKEVNVVSGVLREWIEKEVTRCVRAVGVDKGFTMPWMQETAARKGRKVEKIIDGENANGMRSVVFRFCDVADAVRFKQSLNRDEDWEECNIHYIPDPCAVATTVHMDD